MQDTYTHLAGFALMVVGVIWGNEAVKKMGKVIRLPFEVGYHSSTSDRQARAIIKKYRAKFGNGPLFLSFIAALGICVLGFMILVFSR